MIWKCSDGMFHQIYVLMRKSKGQTKKLLQHIIISNRLVPIWFANVRSGLFHQIYIRIRTAGTDRNVGLVPANIFITYVNLYSNQGRGEQIMPQSFLTYRRPWVSGSEIDRQRNCCDRYICTWAFSIIFLANGHLPTKSQ